MAGIDGGQTSTVAVVADATGVLARGTAGPADEVGQGPHSTRLRDALSGALAKATLHAGFPEDTRFDAIVAGVSGYQGTVYGLAPQLPTDRFILLHDAPIAHAGALDGGPGVVVIAGTGSVAYGVSHDGRSMTTGGWGYLFGDEGSAFWIVRNAISLASGHEDCAGIEQLLSFFDVHSLRELVRGFYAGKTGRDDLASFAPRCIEAAKSGSVCTCMETPVHGATMELARLASDGAVDRSEPVAVSFIGGLMRDAWFKARVYEEVERLPPIPEFTIVQAAHEPVVGAVMLALREAGIRA